MGSGQSTHFLSRAEHKETLNTEPPYGHLPMSPTAGARDPVEWGAERLKELENGRSAGKCCCHN